MLRRSMLLNFVLVSISLAMILSMSGCGGDDDDDDDDLSLVKLMSEGQMLLETEDYEGAREKFDEVLVIDPGNISAYVGLGWAYGKLLNLQESIASFQSALSIDPQDTDALAGIAFAYLADDKYDQAIASSEQVLAIDPGYTFESTGITAQDLKIVLAESYYYKGEFEEAKRVLDITAEVSPAELLEELEAASGG